MIDQILQKSVAVAGLFSLGLQVAKFFVRMTHTKKDDKKLNRVYNAFVATGLEPKK